MIHPQMARYEWKKKLHFIRKKKKKEMRKEHYNRKAEEKKVEAVRNVK